MTEVLNQDTQNKIIRFLFEKHGVRGEIMQMDTPCFKLLEHHNYPLSVKQLLIELACSAILIGSTLKANGQIMVQILGGKGDHAIKYALINIDKDLSFYGSAALIEGNDYEGELSFKDICGEDAVLVISVFPEDGNKWQGIVSLDTVSIAKALEGYFKNSEQLDTTFFIYANAKEHKAGAIMLQIIPEIKDNHLSLEHLSTLCSTMTYEEITSLSLYQNLHNLFVQEEVKVFDPREIQFKCVCSRERCERALKGLPRTELENLISDNGTSMTCQHCGKIYNFTKEDLEKMLLTVSQ
ncbi:Hsp33 family molecular chaperone HslO [Succinatimonas hippei]|uniref:Hsp33 family molecular chaperone HslO n=1 Tax=Succinatimonas hippei TaxID=626938 RepID=UPI002012A71E|nr:Hsp33 family molecular chaperone HslO [Succinatimonas hippei]MCL1604195.1 Hsp33 family molecular chaperone HslO [Succinatimonas hippei]